MIDCHIDYSFEQSIEFNQPTCMIDYSGDWLFNNDSTLIVFNQPACVIDYSTMIDCHIDYSFEQSIEFNQPTCMIDYSGDWLFNNDSTMIV